MKHRRLSVLVCAWLLLGCLAIGRADSLAKETRPAAVKPAVLGKLVGALKSTSEARRLEGLAAVDATTIQQPTVATALHEIIEREVRQKRVTPASNHAARLLGRSSRPEDSEFLVDLLDTRDAYLALTAAEALAEQKEVSAVPGITGLSRRKEFGASFGFRRAVVDAAAKLPEKVSVQFLVDTAENSQGQLRFETVQHLARLTGQEFGGYADKWAAWWQENRDGWTPPKDVTLVGVNAEPRTRNTAVPRLPWPEEVPEFFGVPVYGYRVVFVIDHSRSMASSVDGVTRLKEAKAELKKAVDALSPYAYFNVLAYNSGIQPFARELVQADDANKRAAHRFSERQSPAAKTACFDALYAGLKCDPNLESLYFLSDGEPTVGRIVEMPAIVDTITTQNATQRTTLDTLGIDARGEHEEFLRQLADRNFGQFFQIR